MPPADDKLRRLHERGRRRWPDLGLSVDAFARLQAGNVAKLADVEEERICADDLFLVAACLERLPGAVDAFDAFVWPLLERHLRRMEQQPERLAEMRQTLLVRLFVAPAPDAPPRVAEYTGRGPLIVWLRMAAARLALNSKRDDARVTSLGDSYAHKAAAASPDIELSFIRGRYEDDFVAALRASLAALSDEQRLLLQYRYREELTSDQIAVLVKASRVTAHRRVVAARDELAGKLREALRARLSLTESGVEQLLGLLSSRLVPALADELRQGLAER